MNALELHGLEKHYPDFTLGPIDLELPCGAVRQVGMPSPPTPTGAAALTCRRKSATPTTPPA